MTELDDDAVQAIHEGALPGARFADQWYREMLFEAPETLEEYRDLFERRLVARQEEEHADPPPQQAARREMARIEALGSTISRRRQRKPNLDKLIAKAKAAGATSVMVEGVEMRFGEPDAAAPTSNPWDEVLSRDTH
jgi:hypothetical protein